MTGGRAQGYLLVLIAVVLWAGLGVIGKGLYRLGVEPLTVVTFRTLFACGLLFAILALLEPGLLQVQARRLPALVLYGLVAVALNYACYFYALKYTTVTAAIVIVYAHPALVALLARPIFGEPLDRWKLLALGLTLSGVFLVAQGYAPEGFALNLRGALLALAAAFAITFYNLMGKRLLRDLDSWTIIAYGFLFGGIALLGWWGWKGEHRLAYPGLAWGLIVLLAVFPSILAYGLYLRALGRLEAGRAAIIATLEPVLASLLAFLALGELVEPLQVLGGLLVLGGVIILQARRPSG
ncbi:MAG: DMT family transporter [Candidatus Bipolaricaulia bacterium]